MAITALDGIVQTQASVLAFERIFLLAGIVFLVVLPLLFLLETDRDSGVTPRDAHMEV